MHLYQSVLTNYTRIFTQEDVRENAGEKNSQRQADCQMRIESNIPIRATVLSGKAAGFLFPDGEDGNKGWTTLSTEVAHPEPN
jgi:hypothetical protein